MARSEKRFTYCKENRLAVVDARSLINNFLSACSCQNEYFGKKPTFLKRLSLRKVPFVFEAAVCIQAECQHHFIKKKSLNKKD